MSFLTDLAPLVSHAIFVIFNYSSGLSTLPVIKILPSKTLVLTDKKYFFSTIVSLVVKFFSIIESSICVPNDLGSIAKETPVPNNPFELVPEQLFKKIINKKKIKVLISHF